jgi:hypothetical protein
MSANDDTPIPGFIRHGDRYRIHVNLEREDAAEVSAEAIERDVPPAAVIRERVRKGRRGKGGGK